MNGHLASATDAGKDGTLGTGDDMRFTYVDNAQGLTLKREQTFGANTGATKTHQYLYLDGQGIGDIGNDGDTLQDYAQALARPKQSKEAAYKNWRPIATADFDQNWKPVSANWPGATPGSYTAKAGDTLQGIASALWGDSSLWYLIADANGLSGATRLLAGQPLTIPNKVTNVHNTSQTFRPYDAGRIIGNVSPTLPDAPPAPVRSVGGGGGGGGGCGGVGQILVAIVVIVATVYTAGAFAMASAGYSAAAMGFSSTMAAGALSIGQGVLGAGVLAASAATGNLAGQLMGNALGMQEGINWGGVAAAGLTAGAMAGMSGMNGGAGLFAGNTALNTAAGAVVGQGISILTGQQKEFSWSSLAVSAISAPIAQNVGGSLNKTLSNNSIFGEAFRGSALAQNTVQSAVSAVTRMAVQGGRLSWESVAADSITSTIRGMYGSGSAPVSKASELAKEEAAYGTGILPGRGLGFKLPSGVTPENLLAPSFDRSGGSGGNDSLIQGETGRGNSWLDVPGDGTTGGGSYLTPRGGEGSGNGDGNNYLIPGKTIEGGGIGNVPQLQGWGGSETLIGGAGKDNLRARIPTRMVITAKRDNPSDQSVKLIYADEATAGGTVDPYTGSPGANLTAGPAPGFRDTIADAVHNALGDSNAAGVVASATRAYLKSGENFVNGVANLPSAIGALGTSLANDPLNTWNSGIESLRAGYRTLMSDTPAGQGVRGELLFGAISTAATAGLGRVSVVGESAGPLQTLDGVLGELGRNGDIATELTRRAVQRGRIGSSPQAFGTNAHSLYENLNDRLNRRLITADSPYRISVEEFRDAAGMVTGRRAAGSIGADVRILEAQTGNSVKILDLKTHGGTEIPMSPSRQQQFINRFGLPAEEVYRQR